jgi:membrane protein implicated in regulation of membrane protease activity
MSLFKEPRQLAPGAWSGLAAPAAAGAAAHYTAPWYLAVLVVGMAVGVTIWRWRRRRTGGGPSGRGPSGGS